MLPDLNNVAVWMVSTYPLISKSSSPFTNHSGIVPSTQISIGITFTFMVIVYFSYLTRSRYLSLFSLSFNLILWSTGRFAFFFFYFFLTILGLVVWQRLGDLFVFKIPERFVHLILQNRFWVVHIPLIHMVRFQFLAQFPVDNLPHPVMSSLRLSLQ